MLVLQLCPAQAMYQQPYRIDLIGSPTCQGQSQQLYGATFGVRLRGLRSCSSLAGANHPSRPETSETLRFDEFDGGNAVVT